MFGVFDDHMEEYKEDEASAPTSNMMSFNAAGEPVDLGKRAWLQESFPEGRTLMLSHNPIKDGRGSTGDQWKFAKFNLDGSVVLAKFNVHGRVKSENLTCVEMNVSWATTKSL